VRVGLTLPQFRDDADAAFETARRAEELGLDGVFVFDHLWPIGRPDGPALQSRVLLGALAVETSRVVLGPLVARVSVLPNLVLTHEMETLHRMLGVRLIVALGTGDSLSRPENERAGVPFRPVAERVADLVDCCRRLRSAGMRTWVGGHSAQLRTTAGREADGWNGWSTGEHDFAADAVDVRERARSAGRQVEITWGGQVLIGRTAAAAAAKLERYGSRPGLVHGTVDDLRRHFIALAALGVTWAVCAPLDVGAASDAVEMVAEARDATASLRA
jgi:alkanesulfonate monooxygenase SsuD/methylene tetrahydromethanopterin reductase-like flavin-dependent oxidoreductase (luciferase family)